MSTFKYILYLCHSYNNSSLFSIHSFLFPGRRRRGSERGHRKSSSSIYFGNTFMSPALQRLKWWLSILFCNNEIWRCQFKATLSERKMQQIFFATRFLLLEKRPAARVIYLYYYKYSNHFWIESEIRFLVSRRLPGSLQYTARYITGCPARTQHIENTLWQK